MQFESTNQVAYMRACNSEDEGELAYLYKSACAFVRSRVAAKTRKPLLLVQMSEDDESCVLCNILENPVCQKYLAQKIALRMIACADETDAFKDVASKWATVWRTIVANGHVDYQEREIIESFLKRWDAKPLPEVVGFKTARRMALFTLRKPKAKCEHLGVLTPLGWRTYAKHWSPKVRRAVIARKDCPKEILDTLLCDSNWLVRLRAYWKLVFKT